MVSDLYTKFCRYLLLNLFAVTFVTVKVNRNSFQLFDRNTKMICKTKIVLQGQTNQYWITLIDMQDQQIDNYAHSNFWPYGKKCFLYCKFSV